MWWMFTLMILLIVYVFAQFVFIAYLLINNNKPSIKRPRLCTKEDVKDAATGIYTPITY